MFLAWALLMAVAPSAMPSRTGLVRTGSLPEGLPSDLTSFLTNYVRLQDFQCVHFLHNPDENTDFVWKSWWWTQIRNFLKKQVAYVASGSLDAIADMSLEHRKFEGYTNTCTEVILGRLFTEEDFLVFDTVLNTRYLQSHHWLFLCLAPCWPILHNASFPLDNMVVIAEISTGKSEVKVTFWDVYQPAPHLPQRMTVLRRWYQIDKHDGPYVHSNTYFQNKNIIGFPREPWSRRTNLSGLIIRCTTLPGQPHTYLQDNPDGTVRISGIYGDLWDTLKHLLNFTEKCTRPKDGNWGAIHNGSWQGMIGDLVRGEADIAVAPLDKVYIRTQVVDYPYPLSLEGYSIVIKRPTASSSIWNSYLREFTPMSWLILVILLVVLTLSLKLGSTLSPGEEPLLLSDAFMVTMAALCQTGTNFTFTSLSTRIFFITLFLMCVVVYTFYTSFLVSAFTVNKLILPFENLQEMYDRKTYTFGLHGGGSLENYFQTHPLRRKIWEEIVLPNPKSLQNAKYGLEQVLSKRHAFMINKVYFLSVYFHCGFYILPGDYFKVEKSWPIRKDSPLFSIINYHLISMAESGLIVKSSRHWMPREKSCDSQSVQVLGLSSVMTAFLLLGSLAILAAACMVAERLFVRRVL